MSPGYVQLYVKVQTNDAREAEAIAEAATRPTLRFVLTLQRRLKELSGGAHLAFRLSAVKTKQARGAPQ